MHIIARPKLVEFWAEHPDAESQLQLWHNVVRKAHWKNFGELKATYGNASKVGRRVVFNICGNKFRLIARVRYARPETQGTVYVLDILTHEDYDEDRWKED